jgi:hypothetical protein
VLPFNPDATPQRDISRGSSTIFLKLANSEAVSLTSAVESQFFIFGVGKSYRFNKSLRNGENSDEYE